MKSQFTSLKAEKTNNSIVQTVYLPKPQTSSQQTTSNTTSVNNNEIVALKKELKFQKKQLSSEKDKYQNITSLFYQTQTYNDLLKTENKELHNTINEQKKVAQSISQTENLEHNQSLHRINVLEKLLAERDGQIKGLQESLQLIMSHNPLSLNMSNLNIEESQIQDTSTPHITCNQIDIDGMKTVESILMGQSNQNSSEQQIDISYGEPILSNNEPSLLGGAQPQLMGNSSSDFSIIDH